MFRVLLLSIIITAQISLSVPFCIFAHEMTTIGTLSPAQKLTSSVTVLKDSLGQYSYPYVASLPDHAFASDSMAKFDTKSRSYWLRYALRGTQKTPELWTIKIPFFDTSEVFIRDSAGLHHLVSGSDIPFYSRTIYYGEYPCFRIPVVDTTSVVYIRVTSASPYSFDLRRIQDIKFIAPFDFDRVFHYSRYFHGTFFGVTLALIIFNMIIYIMYREKSYLVYAVFMVTQTLYHLSATGFLQEFVFYNAPSVGKYSPFYIAAISLMGYMYFSQVYLESKKYSPRLNHAYIWLYAVIVADVLLGYMLNLRLANNILLLLGLLVVTFPFTMGLIAYRRKYRPALYFLVASVLSYIAYFIYVMMMMKVLPEMIITRYSLQITFALQSLLFAMGLADRMNLIRKELEQKKLEKERLEKEQEIAINKLLEKQNEELEHKVRERTLELEDKNNEVERDRQIIQQEREKSDALLLNILPEKIAHRLKTGEEMIAERFEDVTVFFSDIVGFTKLSQRISPEHLVGRLNSIFSEFDTIALRFGLEKIKTIGDAYMCVCGLPEPRTDHAERVALFALGVQEVVRSFADGIGGEPFSVRIGIHSGTVVAGVIGKQKFTYDLWGETVNTASRLESHGEPFRIQCSPTTYDLLKDKFDFEERGEIQLKGIGAMTTYFLLGQKKSSV